MKIHLHAVENASRANGPGLRAVIWFQGCTLRCPGCFNLATHGPQGGYESDTESLASKILSLGSEIEGITLSGGEPFQQPEALNDLLESLCNTRMSRIVFSGYTLDEINTLPLGAKILKGIDVLVAGRYIASQHLGHGLLGSSNQKIHLLTPRYSQADFTAISPHEIILHPDGTMTISGIDPFWVLP
jgi:anaerobic ribonucleoside-triphosphate reductase activating protein